VKPRIAAAAAEARSGGRDLPRTRTRPGLAEAITQTLPMIAEAPDGAAIFERKQEKPSLHEQRAHAAVPVQDGAVAPRGVARQAQRPMRQSPAVMHRLPRQADP